MYNFCITFCYISILYDFKNEPLKKDEMDQKKQGLTLEPSAICFN